MATPRWLVPDFEDGSKAAGEALGQTKTGKRQFKFIRALLSKVVDEVLPIKVTGEIQYGINRTQDGWLVYLFNNEGVTKFTDTPETFDPKKTVKVTVQLKAIKAGKAHDLCSGDDFPISGGKFIDNV